MKKKIQVFEMYLYRHLLRILWTEKITNIEILAKLKKRVAELFNVMKKRKLKYFGLIMRGEKYVLLRIITEGKIIGK